MIEKTIPQQKQRGLPEASIVSLPSQKKAKQPGTKTSDIYDLDQLFEEENKHLIDKDKAMQ